MIRDLARIPAISAAAIGKTGEELTFAFPEVLNVIKLCTANEIAVLGVEIFLVKNEGYYASGCSDYDLQVARQWEHMEINNWARYVRVNNELAEQSILRNPRGDDHVYILTASSLKEFGETRKQMRRLAKLSPRRPE